MTTTMRSTPLSLKSRTALSKSDIPFIGRRALHAPIREEYPAARIIPENLCRPITTQTPSYDADSAHYIMGNRQKTLNRRERLEREKPTWCERGDLNPHARRQRILSPARLPFRHSRRTNERGGRTEKHKMVDREGLEPTTP